LKRGLAGRIAALFIESKLTPLMIAASLLVGIGAVGLLPREEEPQIVVPMIDVFVSMPGASPAEIEQRVTKGERDGHLTDLLGEPLAEVHAPSTGIVLFIVTSPAIKKDGLLLAVGGL